MAFAEDYTPFFATADFGVTATFDGSTSVNGIFDDEYVEAFAGDEGISSSLPRFTCPTASVPDPVGKTLLVNSTSYTVVEAQPDGTGVVTLVLSE